VKIAIILPNPSLINEPAKRVDMISIPSKGICGRMISGTGERGKPETSGYMEKFSG